MIAPKYGSLTIAHDTGGLHDTVDPLDIEHHHGNGFLFNVFNSEGLRWAIDRAMGIPPPALGRTGGNPPAGHARSEEPLQHLSTAGEYIQLYENILGCSISEPCDPEKEAAKKSKASKS